MITALARGKTAEFRSFRENSAAAPFHGLNILNELIVSIINTRKNVGDK
jgi:hypothetical protein